MAIPELESSDRTYWRSLRYFSAYRLIIAALLVVSLYVSGWGGEFNTFGYGGDRVQRLAWVYLLACSASLAWALRIARSFYTQLSVQVAVDIVVFVVMLHASGGIRSGFGILVLVTLAGAGLVGYGRLVLSYAAAATLALLSQQVYQALISEFDGAIFVQAGTLSLAFFAVAGMARLLARRLVASEELARRRGEDLERQLKVTTQAIAMLDDGVLVADSAGRVSQANPKAKGLLGLDGDGGELASIDPELAAAFNRWRRTGQAQSLEFRPGAVPTSLSARFIEVPDSQGDALVFLQDVGEQRALAQRLKLAALGRLTGGIAHEIRNPLSAIRYAAELLKEDNRNVTDRRMLEIVLDNTQRLERIVRDILELGRRDRAVPQLIGLPAFGAAFIADFVAASGWVPGRLEFVASANAEIRFDAAHLQQVLWNLVSNAGRYASDGPGAVRISATARPFRLVVEDDGPGVVDDVAQRLFEPFFTTDSRGNGLGLYIARELCEANGCRLDYEKGDPGARFVISGGA